MERILGEHRALAVLRALNGQLRGGSNDVILCEILASLGIRSARSDLLETLDLLEREDAIGVKKIETLKVVSLKRHGRELAEGLAKMEGVATPDADCPY